MVAYWLSKVLAYGMISNDKSNKNIKSCLNDNVQDTDGDVLYVWTTLNLRAEHGFGNLFNQTYVLGKSDHDDKEDVENNDDHDDGDVDDDCDCEW